MHFGQKAPEAQIKSFEDADVGPQVVSESHGCRRMRHSAMLVEAAVTVLDVQWGCGEVRPRLIRPETRLLAQQKRRRVRATEHGVGQEAGGRVRVSGRLARLGKLLEIRVGPQQRIHAMVWKTKALQIWHEHGQKCSRYNRTEWLDK